MAQKTLEEEMKEIADFVTQFRQKYEIIPARQEYRPSLSEEGFGEGYIILYQCLIPTLEGCGAWSSLKDDNIRQMVLKQIEKDQYVLNKID